MALILVADDQPVNRQFMTTLLGYCGHRSIEAEDGAGALEACRAQHPNLVIADILMPTMDGYEFVRMLRQDPQLAQTPVVFWSAIYHEREARALAESCGVRHLITKPSDPEAILEVVAAALRQPSPPLTLPLDEFAHNHSRLLANKLASTVEELTVANLRLAALLDIGQQLAAERDPDSLLRSFCLAARELVGCRYAGVLTLNEGRLSVPAVAGMEAEALGSVGPSLAELPALGEALAKKHVVRAAGVLAAPLRSTNGPLGVAFFLDRLGQAEFGEEDERLAMTLAAQLGVALENALNFARIERHAAVLEREIEERKEAERALRASEQKFAKIFYANPQPMVISSLPMGAVVEVNDSLVEATGFGREELAGKPDSGLPFWDEAGTQELGRLLDAGALPRDLDCTFRTRAGESRIGMVSAERIDLNGLPCRLWILKDITAQKQAERELRESREDLSRAQAVARIGSWRLHVRKNELRWSDETYRIFGVPQGTPLTYEVFLAAVHPDDREMVDRAWRAAIGGGQPYDVEHRILVGSAVKWVRERAELEFDSQGALLGGFGTAQDITERKWSEQRIRHQNSILEGINRIFREALTCETEEQLGRVCLAVAEEVTQSRFGFVAEIGPEGRLDDIAISDPGWEACRMSAGERKAPTGFQIRGIYGRVVQDGQGFYTNDPASHPDRVGLPEGHPPIQAFLGVPLTSNGKTIGMIAVANREGGYADEHLQALEALAAGVVQVFMRKRAERALRAGEERLRQAQKMESIGLLAGGIAHDFNNLLTTIMGNASLLRDDVPEESQGIIESVVQATEKAADLTRQLLAYAGKGRFIIEHLNFSRVVRDMTDLLRASIPKKVNVKLALASRLPGIEADRGHLQQIVMNLVLNAAEAIGAHDTGTLTISTLARRVTESEPIADEITGGSLPPGDYVCLEVADTGCGMDRETRARMFDPFFTTKFMGRGLGLAAVAGIVQSHQGAIQLETKPGRGTIFRVFLPAGAPIEPSPRQARRSSLRGTETVLLVEDEEMVRDFTQGALERYGYRVLLAEDGRQAAEIFEENSEEIGLVLLDLMMPVMGGDEAIDAFQQKRPGVKVIVMSGYSELEALKLFAGKGVSGFLQKPFTSVRLAEVLKQVLSKP